MLTPKFSIITPVYQAAAFIDERLRRTLSQDIDEAQFECIVVDDASTDDSWAKLQLLAKDFPNLRLQRLAVNGGPGIARNAAIAQASGEWLIFVDCDDVLRPDALSSLNDTIARHPQAQLIGYNWAWLHQPEQAQRKDHPLLAQPHATRLSAYLQLQMDGSLIFSAVKRSLFVSQAIQFAAGVHEDVDVMFHLYRHAAEVAYVNRVLYLKDNRELSIVNHISVRHLEGFVRAWSAIAACLPAEAQAYRQSFQRGLHAVIATRLREIVKRAQPAEAGPLYLSLYYAVCKMLDQYDWLQAPDVAIAASHDQTQYAQLADTFWQTMRSHADHTEEVAALLHESLPALMQKTWSCVDLHHSVFLGPDEIRTCCKRFFVDGEMRGDVVLSKIPAGQIMPVTPVRILKDKQALLNTINRGEASACSGCPFLEFKAWGPLDTLNIQYLSFEYHSVCNLKCTYCSDTYYGGEQARYDVKGLVDKFLAQGMLDQCHTIVWGGGEPVVGKHFAEMLSATVAALPQAKQRVLTNSVKHAPVVEQLLHTGQVSVTTSLDAGTADTFKQVRGMDSLRKVVSTLKRYAAANADQVTIKYIFTEGNCSLEEVKAFVDLMQRNHLLDCNFQISCDFKHETIALDAVIAMIALYGLLTEQHCRLVFFDDLLRQRLTETHAQAEPVIQSTLSALGLGHILADRQAYRKVAIWGAGWQSRYLIEKTAFFKDVEVAYFIDSRPSRIGERFMDHEIVGPEQLLQSDIPVVIAAVQNLPIIYQSFRQLGIDEERLIRKLII